MTRYITVLTILFVGCEGQYIELVECEEPEILCIENLCCYANATDTTDCWIPNERD